MILNYIITAVLVVASLILQGHASFGFMTFIFGVKPDILFILVVYLGFTFGSFKGQTVGFIGGLLQDSISHSPLGLLALPKTAIGLLAGLFGRNMFKSSFISVSLLVLVASLVKGILTFLLTAIFCNASLSVVTSIILPETIYNTLLAFPLFWLFDKIYQPEQTREGN